MPVEQKRERERQNAGKRTVEDNNFECHVSVPRLILHLFFYTI